MSTRPSHKENERDKSSFQKFSELNVMSFAGVFLDRRIDDKSVLRGAEISYQIK
jgi:hypothetical protein